MDKPIPEAVALEFRRLRYQADRLDSFGLCGAAENIREAADKLESLTAAQQPEARGVVDEYIEARNAYEAATAKPNSHAPPRALRHGDPIALRYQQARAALTGERNG